ELLQIAPEVQQALHESRPVVALETTLIAHGFPPRVGVEVGLASEAAVTLEGAVAATVGVIDGAVVVGLDKKQIERFGEAGEEAPELARAHWELGGAGLLLGNAPEGGVDVEPLLEQALRTAAAENISGQAVTPFVLSFLHERSGGRTLEVNRELVAANAGLAAQVAVA